MKKLISFFYNLIAGISPRCEVWLRRLYWKHSRNLKKYRPHGAKKVDSNKERQHVDFNDVLDYLKRMGIGEGSLLLVHSSYDVLECTGLSPDEIVDKLLELVGPTGTLAMPAIRSFKGEPKYDDILTTDITDLVCTYKPRKTMVTSGLLPLSMVQRKDSEVSRHPLNAMVAIGPLAKSMMEHNIDGDAPSPHGPGSSWKFCYDHGAKVVGLGVNLYHYNTICHVNEEAFGDWRFSDEEWYRMRKFHVIDGDFDEVVTVKERKPEWGMLRLAELNAHKDTLKHKLITKHTISGIDIYTEDAQKMVNHLRDNLKNKVGFYV